MASNGRVFFFDRDVGVALPRALLSLKLPTQVEYHQAHFSANARDDDWMADVGQNGWFVIGHDSRHHREPAELFAIKQHQMGCFYLWGAHAKRWQKMRCFLRAYERILEAGRSSPRPFVFRVSETGRLTEVPL